MTKGRLEAFSDGVVAILITIMVLELEVPHEATWEGLRAMLPTILMYVLSYVFVGIYWNNHHHLLHTADRVTGSVLWANLHLLFWLSLTPFVTAWMGEHHHDALPNATYGFVLLMSALAYWILQHRLVQAQGPHSKLAAALGRDYKGNLSPVFYIAGIGMSFVQPWIAQALYVTVAAMWLIPDRRLEKK
jgi:uncharacterized membrane protein